MSRRSTPSQAPVASAPGRSCPTPETADGASRPISAIKKNSREEVRVSVDQFKGHELLNVRVWYEGEDGRMRPGKQGIAVRLDLAGELAAAIREAVQ